MNRDVGKHMVWMGFDLMCRFDAQYNAKIVHKLRRRIENRMWRAGLGRVVTNVNNMEPQHRAQREAALKRRRRR